MVLRCVCWTSLCSLQNSYREGLDWEIARCRVHQKIPLRVHEFGIDCIIFKWLRKGRWQRSPHYRSPLYIPLNHFSFCLNECTNAPVMTGQINTQGLLQVRVHLDMRAWMCVLLIAGNEWATVCLQINPVSQTQARVTSEDWFYLLC